MPITKSAKKALRVSERKKVFNDRRKRTMKEAVKQIRALVKSGKKQEAEQLLPTAYKAIDKSHKRGVIKKNTAARKKSRLVKFIRSAKEK